MRTSSLPDGGERERDDAWSIASRRLIAKAVGEFAHELLLQPVSLGGTGRWSRFELRKSNVRYRFRAERLELDDWLVDEDSIEKTIDGEIAPLNAGAFVLEFADVLRIPTTFLPEYLNAVTRTAYAWARRIEVELSEGSSESNQLSVQRLAKAGFQAIEGAMYAGHPVFVANADRRGFSAPEHECYAPELRPNFRLHWVAVRRERCVTACLGQTSYAHFVHHELTEAERETFRGVLERSGTLPADYEYVPVHPWQWRNRVAQLYARDLAIGEIIDLGEGLQEYQPQQSVRTLLSTDANQKHYVKCSLGVVNMGFSRGISPTLPPRGAAVNRWISQELEDDHDLGRYGFRLLREVCFVGVPHHYYEQISRRHSDEYRECLGALWRESPEPRLRNGQRVMTMAALLHVDENGASMLSELIRLADVPVAVWLRAFLDTYLVPLVHCLYRYNLVFTPHAENVLLILEGERPAGMFLKDLAEDIGIINPDTPIPPEIAHLALTVPDEWVTLCIFTDSFDGVLRFLARQLYQDRAYPVSEFWRQVALSVAAYQEQHPEHSAKYERWDLFAPTFARNCLNRLQLSNPNEMLDLNSPDPASCLQFEGVLVNPIRAHKPQHGSKNFTRTGSAGARPEGTQS